MNVYWDTCVFYCYLTGVPAPMLAEVIELINDARDGRVKIHCSTITFAEIRQSALKQKGYESIQEFFSDFKGAFYPVDPNPNIMIRAGELKSVHPINPSDANPPTQRVIGTPDAIHLMTCLY